MKQRCKQTSEKRKVNNKGYSMVSTLVAVSFVTILGVIVLGVSSVNLKTKYLDKKIKRIFIRLKAPWRIFTTGLVWKYRI